MNNYQKLLNIYFTCEDVIQHHTDYTAAELTAFHQELKSKRYSINGITQDPDEQRLLENIHHLGQHLQLIIMDLSVNCLTPNSGHLKETSRH